ncbi:MAG: hypothetical protein UX31_C0011G0028 [Candidatus Nomurabacteria bacterium GW2011_GWA1_46_11]|uniref:NAD-dependent epimerase/dehydratase domain-containing protein n=1 Tax=Candidatus Nomurabacteria bacterium GW2011_GWA1_46_11 TaxID=1618732 RepID=A0A0G1NN16_9BACT|nr:MAG: hypothetical protein UX31_C0011G0028 [Candidatus Nomurabacteria bacterium GW2011_GWA1_46_11]
MKKVVVLGGTGFHGSHVVRIAKEKSYEVYSISRREGVDIRDYPKFAARLKEIQPDAIIDCAGHEGSVHYVNQHAAEVAHDTFQMALNIYRAVAEVCPQAVVINALGNCSYPGDATVAKESEWLSGPVHESVLSSGMEKRVKYVIAAAYHKQLGVKSVNWIMSNCYGPGAGTDPNKLHAMNGIIIRLIEARKKGDKQFSIWGTGTPIREWVYIGDAANMLVESVEMKEQIYPINFAQKKGYAIKEIAALAARELDYPVEFIFDITKADGAPIKILDDAEFRKYYPGFKFTPIETGIKETIRYYKKIL